MASVEVLATGLRLDSRWRGLEVWFAGDPVRLGLEEFGLKILGKEKVGFLGLRLKDIL